LCAAAARAGSQLRHDLLQYHNAWTERILIVLDDLVQFAGQHVALRVVQFKVRIPEMGA
jgi:hypothetical protein